MIAFTQQDVNVLAAGGILFLLALLVVARGQKKLAVSRGLPGRDPGDERTGLDTSLRELLLQLEETNRKVTASIDTRLQLVNRLLSDADAKIAELKKLSEAPLPGAAPAAADDTRFLEVYQLSDQGIDSNEIARRTNRQRGEVDLILSLRKTGK